MQNPVAKGTWKLFKARKWQAFLCKLCVMLSLQSSLMQVFVVRSFKLTKISTVLQVMMEERKKSVQPADRTTLRVSPGFYRVMPKWNNCIYSTCPHSKHLNLTADEVIPKLCAVCPAAFHRLTEGCFTCLMFACWCQGRDLRQELELSFHTNTVQKLCSHTFLSYEILSTQLNIK